MFNYIDPTIRLGSLHIAWYAVFILLGVILAVIFGVKEVKKLGVPSEIIYTGVCIVLPIAIVGARLWYILFNLDKHWTFTKIIGLEGGLKGLAIQGGVIFALIAVVVYCKVRKVSLYKILDVVAPGFLIGQISGRFGNFCNHELYGPRIENPSFIKMIPILGENMQIPQGSGIYYHPTFLYEASLNALGLILMLILRRKCPKLKSGDLMGVYLCWYGVVRIPIEILRSYSGANEILKLGPIPVSILTSCVFILLGIAFLIIKRIICKYKVVESITGEHLYYQDILKTVKENKFDTVLFDLDGTLLDTKPLIDRSFVHTFEHFRPEMKLTDEELDSFFGPTLIQTFSRYAKDEEELNAMIEYYREFNVANHDAMVKVFPGAKDLLRTLSHKGYHLGVVSSKKRDLVEHGLSLFGLDKYMEIVIGEGDNVAPKPAPDGILLAIEKLGGKKACYVGDALGDIKAAKAANVTSIGVIYSKHPEVMLDANPDYVISKLSDILNICIE